MKRFHFVKGIVTTMVAMALMTGFSAPVNAQKVESKEITQVGAEVPTIKIKNSRQTGDLVTAWTISFPEIPEGCELYFNLYEGDKMDSQTGEWITDTVSGEEYFKAWYYSAKPGDTEFVFRNHQLTMGKKTLEAYFFDGAEYAKKLKEYENEVKRIDAEYEAAQAEYARLDTKYWNDKNEYDRLWDQYRVYLQGIKEGWWKKDPIPEPTMPEPKKPTPPVKEQYPEKPAKPEFEKKATNKLTLDVKKTAQCSTSVTSTSVEIRMTDDYVTGYEIYRKMGSKYKKIGKVAKNVFKDSGLASKTKYTYKVRPYYYDKKTKKTIYGIYSQFETMTIGSPLKLKASISGSKNVKLSWTKVKDAVKYEIYRAVNWSEDSEISKGWGNHYGTAELIKTVGKGSKSYTDKKTVKGQSYTYSVVAVLSGGKKLNVTDGVNVSLAFGTPAKVTQYVDKNGKKTVEWRKVIGAQGYIVEKMQRDLETGEISWKEYKKITKGSTTKMSFTAPKVTKDKDGNWITHDYYRIYAYKNSGKTISSQYMPVRVDATIGVVSNVTAKKVDNGIKVSWSKVNGAAYYKVYRIKTGALIKDKDNGTYTLSQGEYNRGEDVDPETNILNEEWCEYSFRGRQVTEYVGAKAPVKVDVAKWNAAIEAYQKDPVNAPKPDWTHPLDPEKEYYYQNYEYSQNKFTGTSMTDYSGEIYSSFSNLDYLDYDGVRQAGVFEEDGTFKAREIEVNPKANYHVGPEEGISYQYYVVAVMAEETTLEDYDGTKWDINGKPYYDEAYAKEQYDADRVVYAAVPGTTTVKKLTVTKPTWKEERRHAVYSLGCKKIPNATFKEITPPKATSIRSIKASKKGKVTLTYKKSSGATEYRIYRSTKSKGTFRCVGTTSKTKYTDTGLKKGKKYYYRVVAVKANGARADVTAKASKVKSVRAK